MRGADAVIQAVERQDVEYIFGHPGGAAMPIFDALFDSKKLKLILTRHEQGATHMADGYARASGRPGVCYLITGPGFVNAMTALGQAYSDSVPVLAVASCLDEVAARRGQLHQMLNQELQQY